MSRHGPPVLPQPTTVRYNNWRDVALPAAADFAPTLRVSVIVPAYQTPAEVLARTLAALEGQTYPQAMFDVTIVDDGSEPPLELPPTPLDVKLVRLERRGFGLARARNAGVAAAAGDILLFLDSDLLAEAEWMEAHARWHHAVSDALTIGFVAHVGVDGLDAQAVRRRSGSLKALLAGRPVEPPWIETHLRATKHLTGRHDDPFRFLGGGNFGIGRAFYAEAGGHDESFAGWGAEDTEFGYRAYTRGGLLVPVRAAFAWHQGLQQPGSPGWKAKRQSGEVQHAKAAHLIAHPRFRLASPGRTFAVPQFVVTLAHDGQGPDRVFEAVAKILADRVHDLVVRVEITEDDDGFAWLREQFGPDPRVRIGVGRSSLDEFPSVSFHVGISASVSFAVDLVHRLRRELGEAVSLCSVLSEKTQDAVSKRPGVSIARSWALHRARRTGKRAEDFGDAVSIAPAKLRLTSHDRRGESGHPVRTGSWNRRTPLEWLYAATSWRVPVHAWRFAQRRLGWTARLAGAATVGEALRRGERIVRKRGALPLLQLALFRLLAAARQRVQIARLLLCNLAAPAGARGRDGPPPTPSVPAFDLRSCNPVGWRAHPDGEVAALGPFDRLPPETVAHRVVHPRNLLRLRRVARVEDTAAYHADAVARAERLVRLAACGVPVHLADGDRQLQPLLGHALFRLMTTNAARLDAEEAEQLGIRMRGAALREHSSWARQRGETLPVVSILLATKRPSLLPWALANVGRQSYPAVELVLALHGDGFGDSRAVARCVARHTAGWLHAVRVLRVPASEPLGGVLAAATAAASGPLLAKMDDDDVYGADHLWDLVLARAYSGARLVGKWLEFVYLRGADRTLRRTKGGGERYESSALAGGTLLVARKDLDRCGGWRKVRQGVDSALAHDVLRAGGGVYRTHGAGFMLVRHGSGHTWSDRDGTDDALLAKADRVWVGFQPRRAGIELPATRPPVFSPASRDGDGLAGTARPKPSPTPP